MARCIYAKQRREAVARQRRSEWIDAFQARAEASRRKHELEMAWLTQQEAAIRAATMQVVEVLCLPLMTLKAELTAMPADYARSSRYWG